MPRRRSVPRHGQDAAEKEADVRNRSDVKASQKLKRRLVRVFAVATVFVGIGAFWVMYTFSGFAGSSTSIIDSFFDNFWFVVLSGLIGGVLTTLMVLVRSD